MSTITSATPVDPSNVSTPLVPSSPHKPTGSSVTAFTGAQSHAQIEIKRSSTDHVLRLLSRGAMFVAGALASVVLLAAVKGLLLTPVGWGALGAVVLGLGLLAIRHKFCAPLKFSEELKDSVKLFLLGATIAGVFVFSGLSEGHGVVQAGEVATAVSEQRDNRS